MSLLKKKIAAGVAAVALGGFLGACEEEEPLEEGAVDDVAEELVDEDDEEIIDDETEEIVGEEGDDAEEEEDVVTAASIVASPDELVASLSEDGNWITAITEDVTVEEEVTVAGTFYDSGDESEGEYRKLALYAQDDDRNVTDEYTLTVPMLTVESPNFRIQNGTVDGDVYVDAEGFELEEATITGDLTFASEDIQSSASINGTVEGETIVE